MAFCGPVNTSMTDTELQATFGGGPGSTPSLLESSKLENQTQGNGRDERGLLLPAALKSAVENLETQGIIPRPPPPSTSAPSEAGPITAYMKKDSDFTESVKKEYCFYDSRYRYSLQQLIKALQSGYNDTNQSNQQVIQKYLKMTQGLNQKLNDLAQLVNEITRKRLEETQGQSNTINSLNNVLAKRSKSLMAQNKILQKEQGAANLYKEMVKFTTQKANYTNNMLGLYSFLNITALGLLFYIYRSAAE